LKHYGNVVVWFNLVVNSKYIPIKHKNYRRKFKLNQINFIVLFIIFY